jgi:hypothetical protein
LGLISAQANGADIKQKVTILLLDIEKIIWGASIKQISSPWSSRLFNLEKMGPTDGWENGSSAKKASSVTGIRLPALDHD